MDDESFRINRRFSSSSGFGTPPLSLSSPTATSFVPFPFPFDVIQEKFSPQDTINALTLVGIAYFFVSAGPIGSEDIVTSGGPFLGMMGLFLYPIFFCLPVAYVIAELATAFPEEGGFSNWSLKAFGPFWAFQQSYWAWVATMLNCALAPSILYQVTVGKNAQIESPLVRYAVKVGMMLVLTLPLLRSMKWMSRLNFLLMLLVAVPFVIFTCWCLIQFDSFSHLTELRREEIKIASKTGAVSISGASAVDWKTLIESLYWNYDGIYILSIFSGSVAHPLKNYSRALVSVIALSFLSYFLPLFASVVSNRPHWSTWARYEEEGYLVVANGVGGSFLRSMSLVALVAGAIGLCMAHLLCASFQATAMSDIALIPEFFKERTSRGIPRNSIFVHLALVLVLLALEYEVMAEIGNAFSAAFQIMLIFSAIKLRHSHPHVARPVAVPGGIVVLCLLMVIPLGILGYMIVGLFLSPYGLAVVGGFVVVGILSAMYVKRQAMKQLQRQQQQQQGAVRNPYFFTI